LGGDRQLLKRSRPLSRKQEFNSSVRTAAAQACGFASVSGPDTLNRSKRTVGAKLSLEARWAFPNAGDIFDCDDQESRSEVHEQKRTHRY
jgi:hypothetical protein